MLTALRSALLGPPRLSKLLYESYLLSKTYGNLDAITKASAEEMSDRLCEMIRADKGLRSEIISIGIYSILATIFIFVPAMYYRGKLEEKALMRAISQLRGISRPDRHVFSGFDGAREYAGAQTGICVLPDFPDGVALGGIVLS